MARMGSEKKLRCQSGFLKLGVESLLHAMRVSRYAFSMQMQQARE